MLDRPMSIERLLAHSVIFEGAARLHDNPRVAGELRRLAENCIQTALVMFSEVSPQGHTMTKFAIIPRRIFHPKCTACDTQMWLSQIKPVPPDDQQRTFECTQCGNVAVRLVKQR